MTTSSSREAIERQAARWTARLEAGELGDAERRALDAWLQEDPEHRWVLARYRSLCARLDEQVPVLLDPAEVEAVVARATARRGLIRWAAPLLAAAAALTLAGLFWLARPQQVETLAAERRTIALADGSRVELNARTALSVQLGNAERRVQLNSGEAFFQVAPDKGRPFLVITPGGTVRVTGTQFNVRQTTAAWEVTVLQGFVQVRPEGGRPDAATPLAAGDQVLLASGVAARRSLSSDEVQHVVAWRMGQVAFQDVPLRDALERFAPYHTQAIVLTKEAAALRVGGRYSLDDLEGFLGAIEQVLPVVVLREPGGAVRIIQR